MSSRSLEISPPFRNAFSTQIRARHAERYADPSLPLADLVHVEDPAFYVDPWPAYDRLRAEAPVYFDERLDTWIVTGYDDVRLVARTPQIYSVRFGKLLLDGVKRNSGAADVFAGGGDYIGVTDPPRHNELRRIMQPPFTPPSLARLRPLIEGYCDRLLDQIVPGEPVDWVEAVAAPLPMLVIASILGISDDDDEFFRRTREWSTALEDVASKDLSPEEFATAQKMFRGLTGFITALFDERRRRPGDDFLSALLASNLGGAVLSEANMIGFTQALIAGGNETVRALLSELIAHLAAHPEQLRSVIENPELAPAAVEETLRYAPPARGFTRQVVQETVLGGETLRPGQRVLMAFDAANRDPQCFDAPHVFDLRTPRAHRNLAFGFGNHVCIAAPLARMEARILLEKTLARFEGFELAGAGRRVESFLRNGWIELPMVFR